MPSTKFQINPNHPNSPTPTLPLEGEGEGGGEFGYLKLEFGAYLGFGICYLGF
jgi:hypothetical protein